MSCHILFFHDTLQLIILQTSLILVSRIIILIDHSLSSQFLSFLLLLQNKFIWKRYASYYCPAICVHTTSLCFYLTLLPLYIGKQIHITYLESRLSFPEHYITDFPGNQLVRLLSCFIFEKRSFFSVSTRVLLTFLENSSTSAHYPQKSQCSRCGALSFFVMHLKIPINFGHVRLEFDVLFHE